MEKFESCVVQLRDIYAEREKNKQSIKDGDEYGACTLSGILLESQSYKLIGVANLFMDALLADIAIPFEYDLPIINQQGEIAGRLRVRFQRISILYSRNESFSRGDRNDEELGLWQTPSRSASIKIIKCRLKIIEAYDLPAHLSNYVFCQYRFWSDASTTVVDSVMESQTLSTSTLVKFNKENEFDIEVNEEFFEYCSDGALSIEVHGHSYQQSSSIEKSQKSERKRELEQQHSKLANPRNTLTNNEPDSFMRALVDSWNAVSKSYELLVQILELNKEGNWMPVKLVQNELNETGGIYQLKQGQSRLIVVRISPVKSNSVIWYNGMLFNVVPHKIDKVSVGCVLGRTIGTKPLDSYQENDLNRLKEKCKKKLEERKNYLISQIKHSTESDKSDEEKERYESICKQLVDLSQEQVSIDAPPENSGLPGSYIDWKPPTGIERHVPVVFLDMNDQIVNYYTQNKPDYDLEREKSDFYYDKPSSTASVSSYFKSGEESILSFERNDYIDLKITKWNDSSMLEMSSLNLFNNSNEDESGESFISSYEPEEIFVNENVSKSLVIKAIASWDSSLHQTPYLNAITSLDKHVYATVKVNLKLKVLDSKVNSKMSKYIDLILRKRIGLSINTTSSVYSGDSETNGAKFKSRFKRLLNSSPSMNGAKAKSNAFNQNTSSGMYYRIITNVPKLITEIENRESLAIKAASSIIDNYSIMSNNEHSNYAHFEQYAKNIEAVDSILKFDRIQQKLTLNNFLKDPNFYLNQNINEENASGSFLNSPGMKKTLSFPNILKKVGFGNIMNINKAYPEQPEPRQQHVKKVIYYPDPAEKNNISFNSPPSYNMESEKNLEVKNFNQSNKFVKMDDVYTASNEMRNKFGI
jgi:hypothetical protein